MNSYRTGLLKSNFYDSCPKQDKLFKQLLYSLTFFDVVVNERKHYGSVGWNSAYEFSLSDFTQSVRQLQMFLCDGKAPFKALQYIFGECFYGGRILDEYDRRLLKILLADIFNDSIVKGPPYKFNSTDNHFPTRFEHRLVLKFIEDSIPEQSSCIVYGLHQNSDYYFNFTKSNNLLSSMKLAVNTRLPSQPNDEDILHKLREIQRKLPQLVKNGFGCSNENLMMVVLHTEANKFDNLQKIIQTTCSTLQQSIQGMHLYFIFI